MSDQHPETFPLPVVTHGDLSWETVQSTPRTLQDSLDDLEKIRPLHGEVPGTGIYLTGAGE